MWGGFIFCAIWHIVLQLLLWSEATKNGEYDLILLLIMNVGLSGAGLCYFGMLAFK